MTHPLAPSAPGVDLVRDVARLLDNFPLLTRQRAMTPDLRRAHRHLLNTIAHEGRPPTDLEPWAVRTLAAEDVIVADEHGITGAYPFSLMPTGHRLRIGGKVEVYAMCSIDAVAVAPVWRLPTRIESTCAYTGVPIHVDQQPDGAKSDPGDVRLGIRWQVPQGSASTSMCREMVFLAGPDAARGWQEDGGEASVYTMEEGIEFGRRFFAPLLVD